ncbi:MAG: flavodoxin family protein [Spirochaetales bacterium]|nr:flavodoxin family protein [Spirochaetales bacterium]
MNIGIIVYSQSGNTASVCEKIKNSLEAAGHMPTIDMIEISGNPEKGFASITIEKAPDPSAYDGIVFASPVQAFSLALPMNKYMSTITGLSGKTIVCFVTKQLPFKWTGGSHALSQMSKSCSRAGSKPVGTEMVIWSSKHREADIDVSAAKITGLFEQG